MKSLATICWVLAAWTLATWFGFGVPFLIVGLTVAGGALWWYDTSAHAPVVKRPLTKPKKGAGNKFNADEGDE